MLEFRDPVHSSFRLWDPAADAIVSHPHFARLKRLKQLGFTDYFFHSAEHTRFPHCLGTAHLARTLVESLQRRQPELEVDSKDVQRVTIAGLCHDLGHGPFSHTFEKDLLPRLGITSDWYHEGMSCKILELIINSIPDVPDSVPDEEDVRVIQQMIDHRRRGAACSTGPKSFLFDIVSNRKNSIDVDKWDYLARDALMCNRSIAFDFRNVMGACKVLDGEICWHKSQYHHLHEMFRSRELLHREVYTAPQVHAVNLMVADALHDADKVFKFRDMVMDPEQFVQLDDTLMQQILHAPKRLLQALDEEELSWLSKARERLAAVERRELFVYINEVKVPREDVQGGHWKAPTPADLISYATPDLPLHQHLDSVILTPTDYDFAMKGVNPMDCVKFYETGDATEGVFIPQQHASHLLPDTFQETNLRLFSRSRDPAVCAALEEAFKSWAKQRFGDRTALQESTPIKRRTPQVSAASPHPSHTASASGSVRRHHALVSNHEQCSTPTSNKKPRGL